MKIKIFFGHHEIEVVLEKTPTAKAIYEALLRQGVIVRPMESYGLGEYIRVTVGLHEENKIFLNAFKEVIGSE